MGRRALRGIDAGLRALVGVHACRCSLQPRAQAARQWQGRRGGLDFCISNSRVGAINSRAGSCLPLQILLWHAVIASPARPAVWRRARPVASGRQVLGRGEWQQTAKLNLTAEVLVAKLPSYLAWYSLSSINSSDPVLF